MPFQNPGTAVKDLQGLKRQEQAKPTPEKQMKTDSPAPELSRERGLGSALRWISALMLISGLLLCAGSLPLESSLRRLSSLIDDAGPWGPILYGLTYAIATVAMVPGSILTFFAGVSFGLGVGTLTVSIASTAGAALSFLAARRLARNRVSRLLEQRPYLTAIDKALEQGGWKTVALMRLSPAIPFNLQNYLWGLTPVRFLTYTLASWIAMLPGTFLYVYLGYISREAAGAATGEEPLQAARWILQGAGLLATVVATIYVTRLARGQLASLGKFDRPSTPARGIDLKTILLTAAGALILVCGLLSRFQPNLLREAVVDLLGPPRAELTESYSANRGESVVDHSLLDSVLRTHVDPEGWVDYPALAANSGDLDRYIESLGGQELDRLGRDERLALLINAYNAFTLRLVLDHHGRIDSILDIPEAIRWEDPRWKIGGESLSLDEIEHDQIRNHFREARIHFALVCAAAGCPPLRQEAYTGAKLEAQLEEQARLVHSKETWLRFDHQEGLLELSPIYEWYYTDFEAISGSVQAHAARYHAALHQAAGNGRAITVRYLDYPWHWELNGKAKKRPR